VIPADVCWCSAAALIETDHFFFFGKRNMR
jgi:hypothetical protein